MTTCLERDLGRAAAVPLPRKHVPTSPARTQRSWGTRAVRWQMCGAGLRALGLEPIHLAQLLETAAYHKLASPVRRPATCLPAARSADGLQGTSSACFQLSHLTAGRAGHALRTHQRSH